MKTVEDYLAAIRNTWPMAAPYEEELPISRALVDEAIAAHPTSAALRCRSADLFVLEWCALDERLNELLLAYSFDPNYAETYECLGNLWEVNADDDHDLRKAVRYLEKAYRLEGSFDTFLGLARAKAQLGDRPASERYIAEAQARFPGYEAMEELATEIRGGEWDRIPGSSS